MVKVHGIFGLSRLPVQTIGDVIAWRNLVPKCPVKDISKKIAKHDEFVKRTHKR